MKQSKRFVYLLSFCLAFVLSPLPVGAQGEDGSFQTNNVLPARLAVDDMLPLPDPEGPEWLLIPDDLLLGNDQVGGVIMAFSQPAAGRIVSAGGGLLYVHPGGAVPLDLDTFTYTVRWSSSSHDDVGDVEDEGRVFLVRRGATWLWDDLETGDFDPGWSDVQTDDSLLVSRDAAVSGYYGMESRLPSPGMEGARASHTLNPRGLQCPSCDEGDPDMRPEDDDGVRTDVQIDPSWLVVPPGSDADLLSVTLDGDGGPPLVRLRIEDLSASGPQLVLEVRRPAGHTERATPITLPAGVLDVTLVWWPPYAAVGSGALLLINGEVASYLPDLHWEAGVDQDLTFGLHNVAGLMSGGVFYDQVQVVPWDLQRLLTYAPDGLFDP